MSAQVIPLHRVREDRGFWQLEVMSSIKGAGWLMFSHSPYRDKVDNDKRLLRTHGVNYTAEEIVFQQKIAAQ